MKKLLHSQSQPMQLLFPKQERRSRRNLLIRLIIACTTLLVSASAYWSYQLARNLVLENLKENAFSQVQEGVNELDEWLAVRKAEVATIAASPITGTMDWSVAGPYLESEVERSQAFHHFIYVQPDGTYYNTATAGGLVVGKNVSHRLWVQRALRGEANLSDPLISLSLGIPKINVASPIGSAARPVGVLSGGITIERIVEVVNRLEYGHRSYAFALNSQSRAIAHPNPNLMSTKERPAPSFLSSTNGDLAVIAEEMAKGQEGMKLISIDGSYKYIAYLPLRQANWSVALVIPRGNIESQLGLLDLIALAVLGLAVTTIAVLWQVQSFEQRQLKRSETILGQQNQQLQETLDQLKQTQSQLIHTGKMSSLGQMVAGVAHEINNPTSFIFGNLQHAQDYVQDLLCLLELYSQECPEPSQQVEDKIEEIDLDYLKEDLDKLFASMGKGCDRINSIVQGLRTFSRLDEAQMKPVDIHVSIDSTLMLLQNHLRGEGSRQGIEVIKDYGDLPEVICYASQLNQVFFHILSNAIDALSSRRQHGETVTPTIRIHTDVNSQNNVIIRIADNGEGMTAGVKEKIFDPFFTTKPVGKGTGLGLAISYQIVVGEHKGKFTCDSELGQGTEFAMEIPISPRTATPITVE
ncbi:MAG: ATP-binding protein [Hormoscilla sp.]